MVFEKLKEIIVDQLNVEPDLITEETDIMADLSADSLDVVEMIVELENEFNLTIDDEEVAGFKTVGDMVAYVESHI